MQSRSFAFALGLATVLGGVAATHGAATRARAEEIASVRASFQLPVSAAIVSVRRGGGWIFSDRFVDFRLPGTEAAQEKLLRQAKRMRIAEFRKGKHLFRSPRTDFGYTQLEYLSGTDTFRASDIW
jgi:hypothetical protein